MKVKTVYLQTAVTVHPYFTTQTTLDSSKMAKFSFEEDASGAVLIKIGKDVIAKVPHTNIKVLIY